MFILLYLRGYFLCRAKHMLDSVSFSTTWYILGPPKEIMPNCSDGFFSIFHLLPLSRPQFFLSSLLSNLLISPFSRIFHSYSSFEPWTNLYLVSLGLLHTLYLRLSSLCCFSVMTSLITTSQVFPFLGLLPASVEICPQVSSCTGEKLCKSLHVWKFLYSTFTLIW